MKSIYLISLFISLFLHLLVLTDYSEFKNEEVIVELSSSKSSFKVHLNKVFSPKKEKKVTKRKHSLELEDRSTISKPLAKLSISIEKKFTPKYPYKSRLFREEGSVTVKVLMDSNANILDTILIKSSGYKRLDRAALEASSRSSFIVKGREKEGTISHSLEFEFKLDD